MKFVRPAVAAAVGASLVLAGAATAAPKPKPVCNLVTDATADTTGPSTALDIKSADIATNAKALTAVIRLEKLSTTDSSAPTGLAYNFRFKVVGGDQIYYLLASVEPEAIGGTTFEYGTVAGAQLTKVGDAIGILDTVNNEVRMTAPLDFAGIKKGFKLGSLQALTQRRFVVLLSGADSTVIDETKTYTSGAASCVKVGK